MCGHMVSFFDTPLTFGQSPSPWVLEVKPVRTYENDPELKAAFGSALADSENQPFKAGETIFPGDREASSWAAINWSNDPIVKAAYNERLHAICLLDKDQFAVMLMKTAQEKNPENRRYTMEAKERVNLLKLYAEVRGFTAKDQTTINNLSNNEMKVVFVKSETTAAKVVDHVPVIKSEISNDYSSPIKVKLVSNGK